MQYITYNPNPSGAYPAPQSNPAPGLVSISDTFAGQLAANKGFVRLTILDGRVIGLEPNEEARETWEASHPETPAEGRETPLTESEMAAAIREGVDNV